MKKLLTLLLVMTVSVGVFVGCNKPKADFVIGLVCLHDENSSYDANFINAMKEALEETGLTDDNLRLSANISEVDSYDPIVKLADDGCNIIFGDSFGYESNMIKAAKEFKDVEFCHGTGVRANTEKLDNYHNAFAAIYEGRYISGVAAGLKLEEMVANKTLKDKNFDENGNIKLGYVGAMPFAEVISGYTAWFLGVKSVVNNVAMEVRFTNTWYSEEFEKATAEGLIDSGCAIISQHADSTGSPTACEKAGVPNCAYNVDTKSITPNTSLIATRINWKPYFVYMINQVKAGKKIDTDWTGSLKTGSVVVTSVNEKIAAKGTNAKLEQVKKQIIDGTLKVFDTEKDNYITVNGKKITSAMGDVVPDAEFAKDTECVLEGYFHESLFRSAPYFDLAIDGIKK